jgi:signal transduction histidine kinase
MDSDTQINSGLAALADYLKGRRDAILKRWQAAVRDDPAVTAAHLLSKSQFRDHVPQILSALEKSLRSGHLEAETAATIQSSRGADHGMHRWQQGYDLYEVMREWGHLHVCLADELEDYAQGHPSLNPQAMAAGRRALTRFCCGGVTESAGRFSSMRQAEAAAQVRDLEVGLERMRELERKHAELIRGAAHDLRGNLSILATASEALGIGAASDKSRVELTGMVRRGIAAQKALLTELLELARLKAGQERREIQSFNAAALLGDLGGSTEILARERGLTFTASGPSPFLVQGDPLKVRRVAQNLLLNALKYTKAGSVTPDRWVLCVQDSGPGLSTSRRQ